MPSRAIEVHSMTKARLAVPDLVSNSYFPAIAAESLGFFAAAGLSVRHELIFPNYKAYEALRDGAVDFVAGPSHVALAAFPEWRGAKLLCALAQGLVWKLVMRTSLRCTPGDPAATRGRRIGAAPMVDLTLRQLLRDAGINDVTIAPVPGSTDPGVSFGVAAAQALIDGKIDGFWANAMGAENAVRAGVGTVILDVRQNLGPSAAFDYSLPVLVTTDALIAERPEAAAAAIRAIVHTQHALKSHVHLATSVGNHLFPPAEAATIADVIARDLPFYDAALSEKSITGMNQFGMNAGLQKSMPAYEAIVAVKFKEFWKG
jgi:ABC-type nitrate/sulfonate/bicarbonate transport system substrate-binding protein